MVFAYAYFWLTGTTYLSTCTILLDKDSERTLSACIISYAFSALSCSNVSLSTCDLWRENASEKRSTIADDCSLWLSAWFHSQRRPSVMSGHQPYRDVSPAGGGHAVDYELQDYYDDTAIPVSHEHDAMIGLIEYFSHHMYSNFFSPRIVYLALITSNTRLHALSKPTYLQTLLRGVLTLNPLPLRQPCLSTTNQFTIKLSIQSRSSGQGTNV